MGEIGKVTRVACSRYFLYGTLRQTAHSIRTNPLSPGRFHLFDTWYITTSLFFTKHNGFVARSSLDPLTLFPEYAPLISNMLPKNNKTALTTLLRSTPIRCAYIILHSHTSSRSIQKMPSFMTHTHATYDHCDEHYFTTSNHMLMYNIHTKQRYASFRTRRREPNANPMRTKCKSFRTKTNTSYHTPHRIMLNANLVMVFPCTRVRRQLQII